MPAKNTLKPYIEGGFYHIYNRGVEKREIFLDDRDYRVFLSYLKLYLEPRDETSLRSLLAEPDTPWKEKDKALKLLKLNNFYDEISLLSHCLIPNHFHLSIRQKSANGIEKFMRSLGTKYVQYFNKRYERVGPLFQGTYKAVLVESDEQLLHLSRYIHIQPIKHSLRSLLAELREYSYSSYGDYLGQRKTNWVHPEEILKFFKTAQRTSLKDVLSYQSFVEDYVQPPEEILGNLILE